MFELADRLLAATRPLAVATAVEIDGSAPRTVGTSMAWDGETVIGSIAGGCVEGAVIDVCEQVLADGIPRTVQYGITDEVAFGVGLTCGGIIRVHVERFTAELADALRGPCIEHRLADGTVFAEEREPERRLIVFGALEFGVALANAGHAMGMRVTVVDPRPMFATPVRFPNSEVVVQWPTEYLAGAAVDERTAICLVGHDARYDAELLALALASPAGYVGAMGSRVTHERRAASLRERGVDGVGRLHSPIGLDIGASTPEETAVAILAEVLAVMRGRTARPLRETEGRIHGAPQPAVGRANRQSRSGDIGSS